MSYCARARLAIGACAGDKPLPILIWDSELPYERLHDLELNLMKQTQNTPFEIRLQQAWTSSRSLVCVGLDPDMGKIPPQFKSTAHPILEFNKEVIDATHDLVCAYKPQIAFYSSV